MAINRNTGMSTTIYVYNGDIIDPVGIQLRMVNTLTGITEDVDNPPTINRSYLAINPENGQTISIYTDEGKFYMF